MIPLLLLLFAQEVPLPEAVRFAPQFSPDGKWIYFVDQKKSAARVPSKFTLFRSTLHGKDVRKIFDFGYAYPRYFFHPDGKRLFAVRQSDPRKVSSLWIIDIDGKGPQKQLPTAPEPWRLYTLLSDGRVVIGYMRERSPHSAIVALDDQGQDTFLCKAGWFSIFDDHRAVISRTDKDTNGNGRVDHFDTPQ